MKDDDGKRELVREVKVGRVRARIWAVASTSDDVVFLVSIARVVQDVQVGTEESPFLSRDDLLLAARALDVAHAHICRMEKDGRGTQ